MALTLGIDVACRAAHQATLAVDGKTVWRGRKFWTRPADLERLWDDLDLAEPGELTVVVEPTRNAWIVVAEWFRRRGATVVMVPTTQSSDLRKYYSKHTKNDRIDSELLARLPLLHPEGLRPYSGQGPADPLRRLTRQRSTMVKRRTAVYARLDALTERAVEEIDEALARMDAGTYGRCVDCDEPIIAERLEAVPAAPTCLRCKADRERGGALV